jgi:hypothetical protein
MNAGAGSPTFFFYGPIAYYFSTAAIALCPNSSPPVQLGLGDYFVVLASALSLLGGGR